MRRNCPRQIPESGSRVRAGCGAPYRAAATEQQLARLRGEGSAADVAFACWNRMDKRLLLRAARTRPCAGEGELVFWPTRHGATLTRTSAGVNDFCGHCRPVV